MVTLKIGNSYSQLFGVNSDQYRDIRNLLSYTIDSGPGSRPRLVSLLSKKLEFPTGLLYLVQKYLCETVYAEEDLRIRPVPGNLFTLRLK